MWGNDAPRIVINQPSHEQWINTSRGQQLHLGLRGLLNGPIDNPNASCVACHALAQVPKVDNASPSLPSIPSNNASSNAIQLYLKNIGHAEDYSANYLSTDYSLQLQIGIANAINAGQATLPGSAQPHSLVPSNSLRIKPVSRDDDSP
jgi:hypothetical protein